MYNYDFEHSGVTYDIGGHVSGIGTTYWPLAFAFFRHRPKAGTKWENVYEIRLYQGGTFFSSSFVVGRRQAYLLATAASNLIGKLSRNRNPYTRIEVRDYKCDPTVRIYL